MTATSELAGTMLGAVLLPVAVGALLYSGAALVRRPLAEAPRVVRLVGAGVASAWLLVVVSLVLLFTQCFNGVVLAGASVALAVVCRRWTGKAPNPGGLPRVHGVAALLAALAAALLSAQVARGLVLPPLAWDTLTYHLTIPAVWIQHGGYWQWSAPDAYGDYCHFPANGEVFSAFLMLPFHGDLLVNLVALPFLALGGAAVFGLAKELGASWRTAGLAAALWVFTPPAFSYVTTQYVDVPMAAEAIAGWLFTSRFLRSRATIDGVLAGAAFGLAAGTKHLGLLPAAVAGIIGLWLLVSLRGRVVRGLGGGALAGVVVGAPWYVRNWIETGNPVYPFRVSLGGHQIFAGSPFQAGVVVAAQPETSYLGKLFTFQPEFSPITFGPPAALIVILGLLGLLRGLVGPSPGAYAVLACALATDLLVFFGETMRPVRQIWGDASQRFLLVAYALLSVGMATLARLGQPRVLRFVLVLGVGALGLELAVVNLATLVQDAAVGWITGVLLVALAALTALPRSSMRWLAVAAVAVWFLGLPALADFRRQTRHICFAQGFDLHLTMRPTAPGWRELDDPDRPMRIAFVTGWTEWGHNWTVYPLFGRQLQNEVVHVPSTQSGALGTYQPQVVGEAPTSPGEWIERLRRSGVQVLFVALPAPPELAWAEAHPEVFHLRASGAAYRIFDVR